jgi:hypothetical protein
MSLPRALLDPIDEAIFYPDIVPVSAGTSEAEAVGINLGCVITAQAIGDIHTLAYYRVSGMAATGTLSLWKIGGGVADVLLAQVAFSGHSGTGWRVVPLPTPVRSNPAYGYVVSLWTPAQGGTITYVADSGYFTNRGTYSENAFLYAMVSNGQTDGRGFEHRNGLFKYGALARPDQTFGNANYWLDAIINARPKPIPPLPPIVIKWPIPAGYPSLANTGPDPDTVFTVELEDVSSTADGQIIENLEVHGIIAVHHSNVTVRNCLIRSVGPFLVYIYADTTGTIVEDCEIDGIGRGNSNSSGIFVQGTNAQILRNNVYRVENGMSFTGSGHLARDNFIHNLRASGGDPPHYDGMQCDGLNGDFTVEHNTIFNENGDTAGCVMLDNIAGPSDNVLIQDNYGGGGGFTMYCAGSFPPVGTLTNVRYYRNLMRQGGYGYWYIQEATPIRQGNQFVDHGLIFDSAPPGGFSIGQTVPECFFSVEGGISGSLVGETVPSGTGVTLGLSFQPNKAGTITGVKLYRPSGSSSTSVKIGIWRWLGANKTGGTELIATRALENVSRKGQWVYWAFETPIAVAAHENLLVGVFIPRGTDGKCWYGAGNGSFPSDVPSQYGTLLAFNNSGAVINGFVGCNGMYEYGTDIVAPVKAGASGSNYYVDPIFSAAWS